MLMTANSSDTLRPTSEPSCQSVDLGKHSHAFLAYHLHNSQNRLRVGVPQRIEMLVKAPENGLNQEIPALK
jgi:hypothetical protein